MPPKSPKGKKKLSKAEKEKLRVEEEEKKKKEDEEANLRKAQEEVERAEREKLEVEQRKGLEVEEAKRRKAQLEELNEIINSNDQMISNEEDMKRKKAKWDRYMRCDGSADPTVAGEINTYINLQYEDQKHNDITAVLNQTIHTLSLIGELEFILKDTPSGEISIQEINRYKQTIAELQDLVKHKLDLASHDVTLKATELMNSESLNLQESYSNEAVRLYVWGNLSKNPRIKSFEFLDGAVAFDIPKLLTLSDCVIRCMITKFDHLSQLSNSFFPRTKIKEIAIPEAPPVVDESKPEESTAEKPDEANEDMERENTENLMSLLRGKPDDDDDEEEDKEQPAVEAKPEVLADDIIKTPVVVPLQPEEVFEPEPEPEEYDDFDGDEDAVDLRAYSPLGGIIHFNLLHMPPQPKTLKSWTITQIAEPPHLHCFDYIADDANPKMQLLKQKVQQDDDPAAKREERPPITLHLKVSDRVFFFEDPSLARWDEQDKVWRQDGFQEITFVEETRRLSFKTSFFGTFALMQDIHINMPFQSWEVRPKGLNHCQLTLIAAIIELEIEVKETSCCLKAPADRLELMHLREKWLPFLEFKQALKDAGVNIFPSEDSHKYVTIQDKNAICESRLYQQMSLTASAMAYSWSKWNGDKERDKIIFQAAPHLKDEPLTEDDWSLFLVTRKRTMMLRMSEFDEEFSEDFKEGTEFHADMYHMALQLATEEGKHRIRNTDFHFAHTVANLLHSTRLLIYS